MDFSGSKSNASQESRSTTKYRKCEIFNNGDVSLQIFTQRYFSQHNVYCRRLRDASVRLLLNVLLMEENHVA